MQPDDTVVLTPHAAGRRRRTLVLIAGPLVAVLALMLITTAVVSRLEFEEPDVAATADTGEVTAEEPAAGSIALVQVDAEAAGPAEIPIDGQQEIALDPDGPCAGVTGAAAGELIVNPTSITLLGGGTKGSVDILNCDPVAVAWSASTEAWVTLADTQGQLPSGATFRLVFSVNTMSLPAGGYSFQIEIERPGHSTVVNVAGTKLGGFVAPGPTPPPVPTVGGLVGNGPSGCAAQCITRAWLTTKPGSPDVSLEVATNTSAVIAALVDPEPPKFSTGGDPFFTSPDVHTTSDGHHKQWTTTLAPLQPGTTYHIIVAAKDHAGGVSYRTGTFTTVKVATGFANQVPGGCTSSCVKSALLTVKPGGLDVDIRVEAHVPLKTQVYANGVTVASSEAKFLTTWSATLELEPGKNYEIKLRVTDEQGNSQTHQARYSTPKPIPSHQNRIRVTFHKIWVTDDADNTTFNRKGELRFKFAVNGVHQSQLDTGEHKVKAPAWVGLGSGRSVVIDNAPDLLPIRVQAQERDNNQRGFCSAGGGMFPEKSGRTLISNCYELEWNTADSAVDLHDTGQGQALPPCYGFPQGVHGDLCVVLHATGDDPTFDVYLTIDFLDD
jgi:hypothetical protein